MEILENLMKIGKNKENFERLVNQMKTHLSIIPFVGAGMSCPVYLQWGQFLLSMASETGMTDRIQELLNHPEGLFEEAAGKLWEELGNRYFFDTLEDEFSPRKLEDASLDGAVSLLPILAQGPVITTNFDRMLEEVYDRAGLSFKEKSLGPQIGTAMKAITQDSHYLIKLHGDVLEHTSWIITLEHYEEYYGYNGKIDYSLPLPKLLQRIFSGGRSLLFLGSSLKSDRTVKILHEMTKDYGDIAHFAVIEKPDSEEEYQARIRFLSKHGIRPIWYPKDQHETVKLLLEHLLLRSGISSVAGKNREHDPESKLICHFSRYRNANFTGREDILSKMKDELNSRKDELLIQVIFGMGGVGKTQVAAEYIHRNRTRYSLIWWINAKNETTIADTYYFLAKQLGLTLQNTENISRNRNKAGRYKVATDSVREWLEREAGWLLVFDNAESLEGIKKYLPKWGNGHILITSRNKDWGNITRKVHVPKLFEVSEAVKFLLKKITEKDDSITGFNEQDQKQLEELAWLLGYLPLALEQAGAYIASGISISEYMDYFKRYKKELLSKGKPYEDNEETIATTWEISFQRVSNLARFAPYLLEIFSFLAADDIPYELLLNLEENLITGLQDESIPLSLADAKNALNSYSLINIHKDNKGISIHRLVQAVVRNRLAADAEHRYNMVLTALYTVTQTFIHYRNTANERQKCSSLLPHSLEVSRYASELNAEPQINIKLLLEIGLYLLMISQFNESKKVFLNALALANKYYRTIYNDDTADILNNLGLIHDELGEYFKARLCYEKALLINHRLHKNGDNFNAIVYLRNLGNIKNRSGKCSEALEDYSKAFEIARNLYSQDDNNIGSILGDIGVVYESIGDYIGAKKYYEHSLEITEKHYAKDPYLVALGNENMGDVLKLLCDYGQSELHYQKALKIYKDYYKHDHPDIARNLNKLGGIFTKLGLCKEALDLCNQAREMDAKLFGDEHPYIARDLETLSDIYNILGEFPKAQECCEKALAVDEQFYGPVHPDVARDMNSLGNILKNTEKLEEARECYEKALSINKSIYGSNHPKLVMNLKNLEAVCIIMEDLE